MSDGHNAWYRLKVRDQVMAMLANGTKSNGAPAAHQQEQAVNRYLGLTLGLLSVLVVLITILVLLHKDRSQYLMQAAYPGIWSAVPRGCSHV